MALRFLMPVVRDMGHLTLTIIEVMVCVDLTGQTLNDDRFNPKHAVF